MTITLTREEAQSVLDALEQTTLLGVPGLKFEPEFYALIETLRARLSAPEPEPVAGYRWEEGRTPPSATFTAPPQREWQGLTDEDFSAINQSCSTKLQAATSAESILKEKNA